MAAAVHGSRSRYVGGCRCAGCRESHTEYMRTWKDRIQKPLAADDPRHGTTNGYCNYNCRCVPCGLANTKKSRDRRRRLREGPGE